MQSELKVKVKVTNNELASLENAVYMIREFSAALYKSGEEEAVSDAGRLANLAEIVIEMRDKYMEV